MPFSVRVNAIKAALRKPDINCNGDEDSQTVSAVHSCWGGEERSCSFPSLFK